MRKGFTLIEILIVIVIIGILATLGFIQYGKTLERARGMEARRVLGELRQAQTGYYYENQAFCTDVTILAVNAPTGCTATHFFSYSAVGTTTADATGTALRCTTGGKAPNAPSSYTINVNWANGTWAGTAGYY